MFVSDDPAIGRSSALSSSAARSLSSYCGRIDPFDAHQPYTFPMRSRPTVVRCVDPNTGAPRTLRGRYVTIVKPTRAALAVTGTTFYTLGKTNVADDKLSGEGYMYHSGNVKWSTDVPNAKFVRAAIILDKVTTASGLHSGSG